MQFKACGQASTVQILSGSYAMQRSYYINTQACIK